MINSLKMLKKKIALYKYAFSMVCDQRLIQLVFLLHCNICELHFNAPVNRNGCYIT